MPPHYKQATLPPNALRIVRDKATEPPHNHPFADALPQGTYLCRQCGIALYRGQYQFHSGCGWPSFDTEIPQRIKRLPDRDGYRVEILCQRCDAHLGHVFTGEGFTAKNIRHCVNGLSLDFVDDINVLDSEEGIFAAGCFWGVEYYFKKLAGVLKTEVGYTGGATNNPSYDSVCRGSSGHVEAIRVLYDPTQINYQKIVQYFFEIHDPTQANGQGPDIGPQYLSRIFYLNDAQKIIAEKLINLLKEKNASIATKVLPADIFWAAEDYHQDYYQKTAKVPYCHHYQKRF
jgi:peptide methionine sulfoxide reductase msrA/msrB